MCQTETKTTAIKNEKKKREYLQKQNCSKTKIRYKTQAKMQQKQNCVTQSHNEI